MGFTERQRGKERKDERERERGRYGGSWKEEKGEDRWKLVRDTERLTIERRQVARSPLAADKVNLL